MDAELIESIIFVIWHHYPSQIAIFLGNYRQTCTKNVSPVQHTGR